MRLPIALLSAALGLPACVASSVPAARRSAPVLRPVGDPSLTVEPASPVVPGVGDVPDPPAAKGVAPMLGSLATGKGRAVARRLRFDVEALPVVAWGDPTENAGFRVTWSRRHEDEWRVLLRSRLFAEVVIATVPQTGEVLFTAFTGGPFSTGSAPDCVAGTNARTATWTGFSPDGWTADGIDVEMGAGDFDPVACTATARSSVRGRAAAVVPGFVYALRVRDGGGPEKLVVFLPRGAFVAASVEPTRPIEMANTGSFTRLTFSLGKDSSASAVVRLSPASLRLWSDLRHGLTASRFNDASPLRDDLLLGVEVSRQEGVTLAALSVATPAGRSTAPYAAFLAAARPRS